MLYKSKLWKIKGVEGLLGFYFHGVLLPLTIISVPVEPEKTFSVRTTLVLEPRRPGASELVKSGRSLVDKNIELETERKPLCTLTPLGKVKRAHP